MLNERRMRVLSALVQEYVRSAQPVGSKSLVDRYSLGCSSATVRNELAMLEETGYVYQPHISAGRVPTEIGYRAFVEEVGKGKVALSRSEVETVRAEYSRLVAELDDLMRLTSTMLTRLTNCVSIALAPKVARARIKRIDLVSLCEKRALVVVITDSGQVVDRPVELLVEMLPEEIERCERLLNQLLDDRPAETVRSARAEAGLLSGMPREIARFLDAILECLVEADRERVYHYGASALLSQPEFAESASVRPLLALLEDGLSLLEALSGLLGERDVVVRIGSENRASELENMSVVATSFGSSDTDGIVGIIGPTRMDYARAIAAVRVVSRNLSDVLSPH